MIGAGLKRARAAARLSLPDLAGRLAGLADADALARYERDEAMPAPDVLAALAQALGVSKEQLLDGDAVAPRAGANELSDEQLGAVAGGMQIRPLVDRIVIRRVKEDDD